MAEVSWDSECEPAYNPFLTLREKRVLINPRVYGKKTKSEKKAFRLEERRRWDDMMKEDRRKNEERREMEDRHHQERIALQRRQDDETAEMERQHESWDGEFYVSPLYYIKKKQEAQRPPKEDILNDCSWDDDNCVSPLYCLTKGVNDIRL